MKTQEDRGRREWRRRMVAGALAAALCVAGVAQAQQAGQSLMGGGQGAGAGGTVTGTAAPQGTGSGGSTAGAGAMTGSGTTAGPGSINQQRYGGGVSVTPEPLPVDDGPTATDTGLPAASSMSASLVGTDSGAAGEDYVLGRGGRCEDYELGRMTVAERISGPNMERLAAARNYLAPVHEAGDAKTPAYILANYQQELESTDPSLTLAGTYLGLVATRRVTPDVVEQVNNLLCLATAQVQAEGIAQTAEAQRLLVR